MGDAWRSSSLLWPPRNGLLADSPSTKRAVSEGFAISMNQSLGYAVLGVAFPLEFVIGVVCAPAVPGGD